MPIRFTIHPTKNLILTQAFGEICAEDLFEYFAGLHSHRDFHPRLDEIFDVTEANGINISGEDLKQFSSATSVFTTKGESVKIGVVASSDLEFALSRMYEMLQSGNDIRVFRERAAAEEWVGVDWD